FYSALTRPNVSLVTDRISRVEPEGVRTTDGALHAVDAIVFATGFETLSFLGSVQVEGRGGTSLRDVWCNGPEAYLGINIAGFPNLFMLYGQTPILATTPSLPCSNASSVMCFRRWRPPGGTRRMQLMCVPK
ncbi:MAG: hypothetical protein JOZ17_16105, partial [Acetobacteraceae bacterium]|nr:hypothetical protein [Acetobacteraceae bacterium]